MSIAKNILQQLGGKRFVAMVGAKNLLDLGNGLALKIAARCANGASHVRVILGADDLYSVEFLACRGVKIKSISVHGGVYADGLASLVSEQCGLALSL